MALVELKSNLANYRSEFTTPSVASQTVNNLRQPSKPNINNPSNSNLNIDSIPPSYVLRTQFTNSFINTSIFDRSNEFISRYTGVTRFNQNTVNTSKYNIDSNPSKFSLQGIYSPSKFNSNIIVNTSKYNIDNTASKFSLQGIYTPSKFNNNTVVNTSKYNIDSTLNKFSLQEIYTPSKFNNNTVVNTSKYNIDSTSSKFSPQGIYSPSKFNSNTVVNTSKYNVDTTPSKFSPTTIYTPTSLYPESIIPDTIKRWKGATAPAVNFFNDNKSGVTGFTTKFTDPYQTKFIGAITTSYTYPKLLGLSDRLVSRPLTNSKFPNYGTATLANQLPIGSVFHYAADGVIVSKKFSTKGYSESSKYGDNVKSIKDQSSKSLLFTRATEENSPSAIDQQYKKFNLRDESHNPNYIRQPFVLRGIQRKGKERPQYWGFGSSKPGFDDGLIQGGIVTVADRVKADLDRIGSWMTSPKGLLWIVKQVGLGLSNPRVETAGLLVPRLTRIHTGVASLLSVAGSPFGLHFTRHGIPFVNRIADYEFVQRQKQRRFDISPTSSNRLLDLRMDLKLYNPIGRSPFLLERRDIHKGKIIRSLSGLGGPNSLYGIGITEIRRDEVTISTQLIASLKSKLTPYYSVRKQYAADLNNFNNYGSTKEENSNSFIGPLDLLSDNSGQSNTGRDAVNGVDLRTNSIKDLYLEYSTSNLSLISKKIKRRDNIIALASKQANPFSRKFDISRGTPTEASLNTLYYGPNDIRNYSTLAYKQIPNRKDGNNTDANVKVIDLKGDFRNGLVTGVALTGKRVDFADGNYYEKNSLETKYGFGNLGIIGQDKTKPNTFLISGSAFGEGGRRGILLNNKINFRGDKVTALDVDLKQGVASNQVYSIGGEDLIKFYFQDGAVQKGAGGYATMAFRATMTGFTDSFSPGWDRIDVMGRPDGAYLYNSFERNISFNFTVAALSRSEMIPMWRKLNYLASYTMPDFNGNARPSGPFMRITIGDLFNQTPGFITSLSYTIPDDCTWDIAEDAGTNADAKQLPMVVEASVSFTIVGDYRPQMHGRVYSLSKNGTSGKARGQWLADAQI